MELEAIGLYTKQIIAEVSAIVKEFQSIYIQ